MTRARNRSPVEDTPSTGMGFREPPPAHVQRYDWAKIAERVKKRPGVWYQVFAGDRQTYATAIRQDSIAALTSDKGFAVRTANNNIKVSPRVCDLWLMYDPADDKTKDPS